VTVYLFFQIPLMFLVMLPAVDGLKPAWREAVANLGGTSLTYWRRVGGPVLAPAALGGLLLLFANSFAAYATAYALTKSGHVNYTITLPEVNPFTVGELLYMFEVATAFTGELLGIDAFDQPGVEEGKNATYALLGKPGYDEKRAELAARPAEDPAYIL
jgi:glucose-6-phosphate isomerase